MNIIDVIRLIRTPNIGPITYRNLMRKFSSPKEALSYVNEVHKKTGKKVCSEQDAYKELEFYSNIGAHVITIDDAHYPALLKHLEDRPPLISILGDLNILNSMDYYIAIIGTRNSSINAQKFAYKIAKDLSAEKIVIVSGMARGIDSYAHQGASFTIGVNAIGLDYLYPQENEKIHKAIIEKGCIISEISPYTNIVPSLFPRRNRIISGLSIGVIVIEATLHSGSMVTAKYAIEQGRDVFCVPGFPVDPRAKGPNSLIKQGGYLIEDAEDVFNIVKSFKLQQPKEEILIPRYSNTEVIDEKLKQSVLKLLTYDTISVDEIIRNVEASHHLILAALLEMELEGIIIRYTGNKISLSCEKDI